MHAYTRQLQALEKRGSMWRWRSWIDERILKEARRETASLGKLGVGHCLVLDPNALIAWSCIRRNYRIIFASDMG